MLALSGSHRVDIQGMPKCPAAQAMCSWWTCASCTRHRSTRLRTYGWWPRPASFSTGLRA